MKYVKMLGLAAVAAAALMAFVGASSASATVLTSPKGTVVKTGTTITAKAEGTTTLTTSFLNITCNASEVSGPTTNESGTTVNGEVKTLTFTSCNCPVTVIKKGTLAIALTTAPNGSLQSTGAEVTVNCSTIFGTIHCIYVTNKTNLGTLTGSSTTGATATMDISSADIPRLSTSGLCDETANWDAKYEVTSPDFLDVS
jgi:hypothetical protein